MKKAMIVFTAFLFTVFGVYAAGKCSKRTLDAVSDAEIYSINRTVILDAGHGGEDGGAVAADGTAEKDLNLIISNGIAAFFELFGVPYIPVRTQDISVCDAGLVTIRERKRSDIMNRFALVNNTPDSVLLSIHQNMFEQQKYNGTQVFYAGKIPESKALAESIKTAVVTALQPENKRETKPSTDSIYLLYHAKTASVMVECGFLSNPAELDKLKTESYQSQMSYFIFKGLLNYIFP